MRPTKHMPAAIPWTLVVILLGVIFLMSGVRNQPGVVQAQMRKPVTMTRLYTGPDGQTHSEEIDLKFNSAEVYKLLQTTGVAEVHRYPPGNFIDWHPAPRRQYVINLVGTGEIEMIGGKKFAVPPGHIDFVEDTTGKGHITRVIGSEDRITLQLPVIDK